MIVKVNAYSPSDWDTFISEMPDSTNYHQLAWKGVIENSFGHKAYYLSACSDDGNIQGILPLIHMQSRLFGSFLVSVPFVNYGGLVSKSQQAADALLAKAEELRVNLHAGHVELRHVDTRIPGLPTKEHKVTMVLELQDDVDSQWKTFNPKLRNQIRKAEKNGLTAVVGGIELLDGFYEVFCRNMRDLGTPVYGKSFFENVLADFPDSIKIITVLHQGKVIASGIASWFRNTIEIPWASSNKDFKALCPNNLLYWEAIRFSIGGKFQRFDFGRSTPGEGTYKFKEQWGARPVQLGWQYLLDGDQALPELNPHNPKYQLAIKMWQKLPVGITRLLGPLIVRNIP